MSISSVSAPIKMSIDLRPPEWKNIRVVDHRTLFEEFGERADFSIELDKITDFISRHNIVCAGEPEAASLVEYGDSWDQHQASEAMYLLRTKPNLRGILFLRNYNFGAKTCFPALLHHGVWKQMQFNVHDLGGHSVEICVGSHLLAIKI